MIATGESTLGIALSFTNSCCKHIYHELLKSILNKSMHI